MSDTVLVALISTGGLIVVALVGVLFQNVSQGRRLDKLHAKTEVVRDQVQNSHGTNLRDDLDRLTATVIDGFKGVRADVQAVQDRQDQAAETVVAVREAADAKTSVVDQKVADLTKRFDRHIDSGAK